MYVKGEQKLRTVLHIAVSEFRRWLRSSRIIILAVMLVFVHMQIIATLQECSAMMGEPVGLMEGFIALGNSGVIVLVVPALFLALMADFPQKAGIDFFYQMRTSKRKWILGQMLFAVGTVVFLVIFLILSSVVMLTGCGEWMPEFSRAVTHYSSVFPERTGDYILQLLPENLYQQMTLGTAVRHTAILMMLYFLLLALVLLVSTLLNRKYAGLLADAVLIALGTVSTAAEADWMWLFPMSHSIPWVHFEKYLSEPVFPIAGSYLYLGGICAALAVICLMAAGKYQAGKV